MATLEGEKDDIRQERSVPLHMIEFGLDLVAYEGVFIPEHYENWRWTTECFPPVYGLDVLQLGCGVGLPGLHLAKVGARSVTSVDASASAVLNTAENARRNDIHNFNAFQSDVFSNVSPELRFDIIFWNIPSQAPLKDGIVREFLDPGEILLKRFLSEGQQWLKQGGRMMLSFGKGAGHDIIAKFARENQLESSVVVQGSVETHTETFRLTQIRRLSNVGQVSFNQSHTLTERARNVYPGGVTRVSIGTIPIQGGNNRISMYAHSGEGARITDVDGNNYVDFHNNFSTLVHGHRHPETIAAIACQLQRGTCFGNPTATDVDLAEIISERVSAIERLRFLNSGTEAVMFAIKAARAITGRTRLAKLEGAFHGTYDWAEVSTRSRPDNWGESPNSNPPYRNTPPHVTEDVVVLPFNDVERARNTLERHGAELACIIVDMLPCAAGMIPIDESYLTMLQDVAHKHGILLISDEVVCFRLGYQGASAARSFQPDLVTLGKLIGGGLPIGLVGGKKWVMEAFAPLDRPPVPQGGTFSANPLTMAAGHAALAALTAPELDRINALGCYLRESSEEVAAKNDVAITVQGSGSLFRFHAKRIRPYDYRSGHHDAVEREVLRQLQVGMLERGIYVAAPFWGSISTSMNKAHIDNFLDALRACLLEMPEIKGFDRRSR
ncbi:Glutamate-1-semialdehyde 2,1-aminomutase 1 [Neorhizobium galegae bv. orientalis]|nr:Glutamate-1-semialdehyde 2,1-aminomutase 1 [Neorhizobium galegae bv. orientalis]